MKRSIILCFTALLSLGLSAQDLQPTAETTLDPSFGFSIGTVTLNDKVYNSVRLTPELEFGKLALGLDIDFRFTFDKDEAGDTQFEVYQEDWYIPEDATAQKYLNLYLSKFSHIRWGEERDPLHVRFGSLTGSTLGTGFVMGGYTNTMFLPERRIFGGQFNLDGQLFNFPYVGVQGLVSNLSEFDLFGARMYIRPGAFTEIPVLSTLEIGGSYYMDRDPLVYQEDFPLESKAVDMIGIDTIIPIFSNQLASLALMGDYVFQGENRDITGSMVGLGGNVLFFTYNGQMRFMGENFQSTYFDQGYDLQRHVKYLIYSEDPSVSDSFIEARNAYLASVGAVFMQNALVFNFSVEGPLEEADPDNIYDQPRVKGIFYLEEGTIDMVDFQFWYDKMGVTAWDDLVDPTNALIGGLVNFHMSPAVITLQVDVKYDTEDPDGWDVTSQISTGIQF